MAAQQADCPFCKIVAGEVPADIVVEGERTLAFRDINPQAPTHVLIVPREHFATAAEAAQSGQGIVDEIARVAQLVAQKDAIVDSGYRLLFNTGAGAGQVVFHVHGHVLGGRPMEWPPG